MTKKIRSICIVACPIGLTFVIKTKKKIWLLFGWVNRHFGLESIRWCNFSTWQNVKLKKIINCQLLVTLITKNNYLLVFYPLLLGKKVTVSHCFGQSIFLIGYDMISFDRICGIRGSPNGWMNVVTEISPNWWYDIWFCDCARCGPKPEIPTWGMDIFPLFFGFRRLFNLSKSLV